MPTHCILVVDDDPDVRDAMKEILRLEGYTVQTAANGREALEALEAMRGHPCLVLLDMIMPEMTGEEFCRALVERGLVDAIPIVIAAGRRGFQCEGARAFLHKPVSMEELITTVRKYCGPPDRQVGCQD